MSWASLAAVSDEIRAIREEEARRPLLDCPICGNVLDVNSRGEKNCDVGHFTTRDTANGGA
jgi:hypothetical protein